MSVADRRGIVGASAYWLQTWPRRYGFALISVVAATLLRYLLSKWLGHNLPFLLFYPAIWLVAWMAGWGPGVFAVVLFTMSADYLLDGPANGAAYGLPLNANGLILFMIAGLGLCALADMYRRRTIRLREFEEAVEGLDEMIAVVDRDYRYVTANRAFLEYRKLEKDDLVGRRPTDILSPGVFEATVKKRLDECFAGKIVQYEMRYTFLLRGERDLFVTYYPIEGPGGIERVVIVLRDITERKEAERSSKLFRTLIDQSNEGVEVVDPETLRFLDVNEKTCQDLGYTREELLNMNVLDINPFLDERTRARVREKLQETGSFVREGFHRRKDGTIFPVETSMRLVQRERAYVVAFSRDISDRRRAESALVESEDRYRDLVEHSEDLVCTHDLEGNLLSVNPAPARLLGYEVEEFLKIPMRELIVPEYRGIFDEYLVRIRTSRAEKGLLCVLTKSGEQRIWDYNNTLRTEGVPVPIVRGMAHDVTEKRAAELARSKAEQLRVESEERFRVALKDKPITVFNQDRELRYTWAYNPRLYSQHELIGKTDEEVLGPKRAATLVDLKRRVLESGVALREDVEIAHEGKDYAFDIAIEPLLAADGSVIGITGAAIDIARFKEKADGMQADWDKLAQEKLYLEGEIQTELGFEEIIGHSPALREVLRKARIVAPTDSTVLLLGETGTGKELVARSVHSLSARRDKTFIKLNCAAVPSGLLESELFGHEKGAFTGAVSQKVGRIELADKGTLFLDEIGELPLELQPKLLRVLQDRDFERLGGVKTLHVDVRIISATNRDLRQDIADRAFREDLYYRLNVFPIELPALRERRGDIPMLVRHFVQKHAARMGKHIGSVPPETMAVLENWNWPGNIRELENMIERMVIMSKGRELAEPPVELEAQQEVSGDDLSEMEREHIVRVLRETRGVLSGPEGAASRLGMKRTTLQSMIKRFGIELEGFRRGSGTFGPN